MDGTDTFPVITDPARVQFGPRDDDTMPVTWAERLLRWLHDERPQVFMDGMHHVMGIERTRGRGR